LNKYPVAKILKEFGLGGFLKIKIYFTPSSYFKNYKTIFIKHKQLGFIELEIEKFKILFNQFALIKFKNINNREEARKLKGYEIYVYENELPPKSEDEFYIYELENLNVYYKDEIIGFIESVIVQNGYALFKIKTKNNEIFIPFNKNFIERIDLNNKACYLKNLDETILNS